MPLNCSEATASCAVGWIAVGLLGLISLGLQKGLETPPATPAAIAQSTAMAKVFDVTAQAPVVGPPALSARAP